VIGRAVLKRQIFLADGAEITWATIKKDLHYFPLSSSFLEHDGVGPEDNTA